MESIKDVFEAFAQRVRSPIIGYVILFVVLINWKAFYFLFFSGEDALIKFDFFDASTRFVTLVVLPVILGVITALTTPWLNLGAQIAVQKPIMMQRARNADARHQLALIEAEYKDAQNKRVQTLIDEAKQNQQIQEIDDETLRDELQKKVDEIREDLVENDISYEKRLSVIEAIAPHQLGTDHQKKEVNAILRDAKSAYFNEKYEIADLLLTLAESKIK